MALMPFGSPPDKWQTDTYFARRYISPKTESDVLYIGDRDAASAIESSFAQATAVFVGSQTSGTNYFINPGYGTSFIPFGGLYVVGRAKGTFASPTDTQDGDWLGGYTAVNYRGGAWQSGSTFALPGMFFSQLDSSGSDFGTRMYFGSALFEGVTLDMPITGTPQLAFYINRVNYDIDTSIGWDSGTAMFVEGSSGQIQVTAGTASVPALSTTGDTDTGIYFPSADVVGVTAEGVPSAWFGDTSNSPYAALELMPSDRTLGSNNTTGIGSFIKVDNTYTLNTATAVLPAGYDFNPTVIFSADGYGFGSGFLMWNHMLVQNDSGSTRAIGGVGSFIDTPIIQANGGSLSVGFHVGFLGQPTFNRINSGTISSYLGIIEFWSNAPVIGAGVTLPAVTHFQANGAANSGTVTNQAGFISTGMTTATNNTDFLIGTQATGNWGIYQSTTTDNYFAGDVQIADGSAASPSLTFGSDTDTGIHRVGANQFSFDTSGVSRMQVSATEVVVNPGKIASNDFRVHGDTVDGLIFADVSADALGFFNATPIARPTTAYGAATFVANTSGIANDTATFDGYTIGQVVKALRDIGILT